MALRIAYVTSGMGHTGTAICQALHHAGHRVVAGCGPRSSRKDHWLKEQKSLGYDFIASEGDATDWVSTEAAFAKVRREVGDIDVLVNNAGVLKLQTLADTTDEQYDQTFDINTRGTFNTLREAGARLADGGAIVNVSSTTLALNMPTYGIYIASKAAVEGFTRVFAKELRGRRITVNAVAPGPVATDLFKKGKSPELIEHFAKMPPLERLGEPEDISGVVSFLASQDGGWINGQVLRANGGIA